ncbi:recombinase family protein [Streptomyces sp. NPDC046939]|uniref:recombinase family protein n=1 Tax=Streptomyces sp. NPDC046939 TaxID=3155376 RepID=UPI0033D09E52
MKGSACPDSVTSTITGAEVGIRDGTTRAPCSAPGQDDDSQLDALRATAPRGTGPSATRPTPGSAAEGPVRGGARTVREVKARAPHCRVVLTVYEMKRLGRDATELIAPADNLTAHGLVLKMHAGPLPGTYDPTGPGKLLFAFFSAMAETEREDIRESTLEGLDTAAREGKHGGRPPATTADMLHTVLRHRAGGESVEQIQPDRIALTGRGKGLNPSVASIYRALADHAECEAHPEAVEAADAELAAPRRPWTFPPRVRRTSRSPPGTPRSSSSKRAARPSPVNGPSTLLPCARTAAGSGCTAARTAWSSASRPGIVATAGGSSCLRL